MGRLSSALVLIHKQSERLSAYSIAYQRTFEFLVCENVHAEYVCLLIAHATYYNRIVYLSKTQVVTERVHSLYHMRPPKSNKKAQLSLTNPRDAKACQKLLQFDVLTTLSLTIVTILAYLHHAFSCCCVRNLRNPEKFNENSNLWSSRSSKVIDLGANRKHICDLLLVINSNFSRICYRFRDIHG